MERLPFEVGRVVRSMQGRDEGRFFLIVQVLDEQYVQIADGCCHKLNHPKKKKLKHLRAKPLLMQALQEQNRKPKLLDSDLRSFLEEAGLGMNQPVYKEG